MKRIYVTRVERGENIDSWEYNVVASSGQEAAKKALAQAKRDSGVKGSWRVVKVSEQPGYVIS